MDSLQQFSETSLPDKKEFDRSLTIEGIIDAGWRHTKRSGKISKSKT